MYIYIFCIYGMCLLVNLSGEQCVVLVEVLLFRCALSQFPLQLPNLLLLLVHLNIYMYIHTCMCAYTDASLSVVVLSISVMYVHSPLIFLANC